MRASVAVREVVCEDCSRSKLCGGGRIGLTIISIGTVHCRADCGATEHSPHLKLLSLLLHTELLEAVSLYQTERGAFWIP